MNNQVSQIQLLFKELEALGKTTIALTKLRAIAKFADVASSMVVRVIIFAILWLFVLIISMAFALLVGELLGKVYYGFFCVGFFYAFVIIILCIFKKKWLKMPISNHIILQLLP
jgi:hypothetical protein